MKKSPLEASTFQYSYMARLWLGPSVNCSLFHKNLHDYQMLVINFNTLKFFTYTCFNQRLPYLNSRGIICTHNQVTLSCIFFHLIISKPAGICFYREFETVYNIICIVTRLIYGIAINVTRKIYIFDNKKTITEKNIEQNWTKYRILWGQQREVLPINCEVCYF